MSEVKLSLAKTLVMHVWNNAQREVGHSWTRLNEAMWKAVNLAIIAGLTFSENDFKEIYAECRGGYWFGERFGEHFYTLAVERRNTSACLSFEAWRERKPFLLDGNRVHEGMRFDWKGKYVTVTSFCGDGSYFIACSYVFTDEKYHNRKIEKRFKINHEDLRRHNKALARISKAGKVYELIKEDKRYRRLSPATSEAINKLRKEISEYSDDEMIAIVECRKFTGKIKPKEVRESFIKQLDDQMAELNKFSVTEVI